MKSCFEQILAEGAIDEEGMYIDCAEYEIDLTDLVGAEDLPPGLREWDARLTGLSASFLDEEDEGTLEEGWASTDNGEVWVWISKDTTARSNPSGYALYFKQEDNEWVFFGSCEIL